MVDVGARQFLKDRARPLRNALAEIKAVTFEPKQTLPAVKRRIDGEPEAVAHGL